MPRRVVVRARDGRDICILLYPPRRSQALAGDRQDEVKCAKFNLLERPHEVIARVTQSNDWFGRTRV